MSTVTGNCIPLARLRELAADPAAADQQLIAVVLTMLDEDEEVRAWASDVLTNVEQPAPKLAPQLVELTRHVDAPVAGWACKLLGRLGSQATQYQHALANAMLTHTDLSVKQLAALALQNVPELSQATLDALRVAASSTDSRLSRLAEQALRPVHK